MDYTAEKLHKALLIIADEIKRICEKNEIKYFLICGSLLGAVRHKGFIPWDDDLDIGMLREDYDRFYEEAKEGLNEGFFLSDFRIEETYGLPYMKVRLKDTFFPEEHTPKNANSGIFVDVFPIDMMPKGKCKREIQSISHRILSKSLLQKCGYLDLYESGFRGKIVQLVVKLITRSDKARIIEWIRKVEVSGNDEYGKHYIGLCTPYKYGKDIYPIECLKGELTDAEFENTTYKIPRNPKKILSLLYGDYMKLPPAEQQKFRHLNGDISFGNIFE